MAVDQDSAPRKLVYLRDRTLRSRPRTARPDRRATIQPATELVGEATWLGRVLFVVAASAVAYWILVLWGALQPSRGEETWRVLATTSLAHAFMLGSCALAAHRLLRDATRSTVYVAVAAGALIVVALEGLAGLLVSGELSDVSLSVRSEILATAANLAIGVWAFSYALRLQRRERSN